MPLRLCLVLALILAVGSCGRRGDLERPEATFAEPADAVAEPGLIPPARLDSVSPGAQEPEPVRPGDAAPQRRFVLDPLI